MDEREKTIRTLEILGVYVNSILNRVEQLEKDNQALRILMSPSPIIPVADTPVRDVTHIDMDRDLA